MNTFHLYFRGSHKSETKASRITGWCFSFSCTSYLVPTATMSLWTVVSVPDYYMGLWCGACLPFSAERQPVLASPMSFSGHSSVRDACSLLLLHKSGAEGAWLLIWAQTMVNRGLSLVIPVAGAGTLVSPFPRPQVCHLCNQGYNISLRNLYCVDEEHWIEPKNFVILKFYNVFISLWLTANAGSLLA